MAITFYPSTPFSVSIPVNGSKVTKTISWTKPGSSYTVQSLKLKFTTDTSAGYSIYTYHYENGTAHSYGTLSGASTPGGQYEVSLDGQYISKVASGETDTIYFRFLQRTTSIRQTWSNVQLEVTYTSGTGQSTVVVSPAIAGEPQTVTLSNTDSTAYHKVTWTYGSITSGEQAYAAATRSPAWAIPSGNLAVLYRANPNSATATGTITVKTYTADGSLVGTQTVSGTLTIPASAVGPSAALSIGNPAYDDVGTTWHANNPTTNIYLQNHTTISCTITATTQYNATVVSTSVTTPDGTFEALAQNTPANADTMNTTLTASNIKIAASGDYPITVSILDSRGYTTTTSQTIQVTACPAFAVTSLTAFRCNSTGTADDEGAYISVTPTANATEGVSQVSSWKYAVYPAGSSTPEITERTMVLTNGTAIVGGALSTESAYDLRVTAMDSFGQTAKATATIGTSLYTIHRMAGGKGVAFGKVAEMYGVEVNPDWPFYAHGQEIQRLILDMAHPVGSVLQTFDDAFNPNEKWPWSHWGRVRDVFLYASGTKGTATTGGNKENGIVSLTGTNDGRTRLELQANGDLVVYKPNDTHTWHSGELSSGDAVYYPVKIGTTAAASTENNMPPYIAVNTWVRTQ